MFIALLTGLLLVQEPAKKDTPPVVPADLQLTYWKELAAYHSTNSQFQGALMQAAKMQEELKELGPRVESAGNAMRKACGDKYQLDQEKLKSQIIVCVPKPVAAPAPKR